jgi:hypothetical protein
VRQLFGLPRTASHELAVILFNVWPAEIILLKRRQKFLRSVSAHDFTFVCGAALIDQSFLLTSPLGWNHNSVRLMRRIDCDLSTVNYNARAALDNVLVGFDDCSLVNFFFITDTASDSLSFF